MKRSRFLITADTPLGKDQAELVLDASDDTLECTINRSESQLKFSSFEKIGSYYTGSVKTLTPIECNVRINFLTDSSTINGVLDIDQFCSIKFIGEKIYE